MGVDFASVTPRKALSRGQGGVGAFLRLGGVMIPLGGVGRFQSRFSMSIVGQEFGVGLRVTKRFWQQVFGGSFNGGPLLGAGSGCFCTVSGTDFGSGATTGGAGATTATGATEASSGLDTNILVNTINIRYISPMAAKI
jgi:hypothetical protein